MKTAQEIHQIFASQNYTVLEIIKLTQQDALQSVLQYAYELNDRHEWPITRWIEKEMKDHDLKK